MTDQPTTFRDVFTVAEYRALFVAAVLSWVGDYFAKVVVAFLVFSNTGSVVLSATSFAISYLPWLAGGPVLAAVAERYPHRRVMIICDAASMALVSLMALPGLPLPVLFLLLLGTALLTPPFQAARSAMLARLLTGDRYVQGISLQNMAAQAAQVAGYAMGGPVAAVAPRGALLVNAATFGASALLLWCGVRPRPAAATTAGHRSLLKEAGDGLRVVFGHQIMRPIALVVFSMVSITIVPEGLAAAWAAELGESSTTAGLLMAAIPVGTVVGGVLIRVTRPERRLKMIKPLLLANPLLLVPALAGPPAVVVFLLVVGAGVTSTAIVLLNGIFVRVLPDGFRARAFGIMQGGVQITLAVAVLTAGALADRFSVSIVVGTWSLCGLVLMGVVVRTWPRDDVIDVEIARVEEMNRTP